MVEINPRLASLTTQPPTPPREKIENNTKLMQDKLQLTSGSCEILLNTPDGSPSSSAESCGLSLEKSSKRVGFSPWTKYHKPPRHSSKSLYLEDHIRVLPPSRDCKSSRSILKPTVHICIPAPMGELMALSQDNNVPGMLEATTQHLDSSSRNSRIDAYSALLGCLGAYDDVPGLQDLSDRLIELLRYIRRDIVARQEGINLPDIPLVTQALKLLIFFLSIPSLTGLLPEEFCAFIAEQAISSLENKTTPNNIISHYMHILVQQNFSPQHMSSIRVNRLITALGSVADTIKGNRVVGQRLMVYKRLLSQAKPIMILRVVAWVDHLISGMLSTVKDIRTRAISFGMEASLSLGTIRSVSQTILDAFESELPGGRKVVDFLASRLTELAKSKDDGVHVLNIWSIVILFLRSRRNQLEKWDHLKTWITVIQISFNLSDTQIKAQANFAWGRLIFAVNLDSSTSLSMVKMLRQPIVTQLDRKYDLKSSKTSRHASQIARSSYCTLLYYAFRPSATHAQLDQYWEEYVSRILLTNSSTCKLDIDNACDILAALFSSAKPKAWDENRANVNALVKAHELPCLDSKWVRSRAATILKVFDFLLHTAEWQTEKDQEAPILMAWRSFTTAIGAAGSKEVKTSIETISAIANMLNTIKHFWQHSLEKQEKVDLPNSIRKFDQLVHEAVSRIGIIAFNEKRLMLTLQESYEAAETPSSRSSRCQESLSSPISILLCLLVDSVGNHQIMNEYKTAVGNLVQLATRSATSRRTQLSLLSDLASIVTSRCKSTPEIKLVAWQIIAEAAGVALTKSRAPEVRDDGSQCAGLEFKDAVKILSVVFPLCPVKDIPEWENLGALIVQALQKDIGADAIGPIVAEPLATAIYQLNHTKCNVFLLQVAGFLLTTPHWPQSQHDVERAQKLLRGASSISKPTGLNSFNHLYSVTNSLLKSVYTQLELLTANSIENFLSTVTLLVSSCPIAEKGTLLKQLQEGLALWIEDDKELLTATSFKEDTASLCSAVKNLWAAISIAIEAVSKLEKKLLSLIEILVISSLRSRHKAILNDAVLLWNRAFGISPVLEYPDNLLPVLSKLKCLTYLQLPNFPERHDPELSSSPIDFLGSQIDEAMRISQNNTPCKLLTTIPHAPTIKAFADATPVSPCTSYQSPANGLPPFPSEEAHAMATPTVHHRHEKLQIKLAAIESSPISLENFDSQVLTGRHKETRGRQDIEAAAMFPCLVPLAHKHTGIHAEGLLRLNFEEDSSPQAPLNVDENSPTFPSIDGLHCDILESSPTPRPRRKNCFVGSLDVGTSSSPSVRFVTKTNLRRDHTPPTTKNPIQSPIGMPEVNHDDDSVTTRARASNLAIPISAFEDSNISPHPPLSTSITDGNLFTGVDQTNQPNTQNAYDTEPVSDAEEYVDAQSDLSRSLEENRLLDGVTAASACTNKASKPTEKAHQREVFQGPMTALEDGSRPQDANKFEALSCITDSLEDQQAIPFPTEDDQIAAQLVSDLERASSQAESEIGGPSPIAQRPKINRKRKGDSEAPTTATKKTKISRQSQNFQILVKSREPIDIENDGLAPDANGVLPPLCVDVKPEEPESPTRISTTTAGSSDAGENTNQHTESVAAHASTNPESRSVSDETDLPASGDATVSVNHCAQFRRRSARLCRKSEAKQQSRRDCGVTIFDDDDDDDDARSAKAARDPKESRRPTRSESTKAHEHADDRFSTAGSTPASSAHVALTGTVYEMGAHDNETDHNHTSAQLLNPDDWHGLACDRNALDVTGAQVIRKDDATTDHRASPPNAWKAITKADTASCRIQTENSEGREILRGLSSLLEDIKQVKLGAEEERQMIQILFATVHEVQEAGRRYARP